jgi:hypothetical protein
MEEEEDDDNNEWRSLRVVLSIHPSRHPSSSSLDPWMKKMMEQEDDHHSWRRPGVIHMIMWVRNYNPMLLLLLLLLLNINNFVSSFAETILC